MSTSEQGVDELQELKSVRIDALSPGEVFLGAFGGAYEYHGAIRDKQGVHIATTPDGVVHEFFGSQLVHKT